MHSTRKRSRRIRVAWTVVSVLTMLSMVLFMLVPLFG
jgi:predicted nucleic acid-binding Zn ribbon protein